MVTPSLGTLADPERHRDPVDIAGVSDTDLEQYLARMLLIRHAEQCLAVGRQQGLIGGPVHLGVGQEAVAVGVSAELRSTDRVFGAHRSHSHVLAMGSDVRALFAEVLGKDTGLSRGMGGSMHLCDMPRGFYGSVPIVAGTVPIAVGAGLAAKMQGLDAIGVAYLGDGALEEGVVHESLNLARVLDVPVLFVVENNLFASHMHISLRQPSDSTARFAEANHIPFEVVDGNDVVAVRKATAALVSRSRAGGGPGFLEAVTYRWYGHVDWREDIDVGVDRSAKVLANWRQRDPVRRLVVGMDVAGKRGTGRLAELDREIGAHVAAAWTQAMADAYPSANVLLDRVYHASGTH